MSTKTKPAFIVRGFDPSDLSNCTGTIENVVSFQEDTCPTEAASVSKMLADFKGANASDVRATNGQGSVNVIDGAGPEVIEVNLCINLDRYSVREVRQHKTNIREALKRWAEKSRVVGLRGFRVSAVRTPTYSLDKTTGKVKVTTKAILSNAVWYSGNRVTVGGTADHQSVMDDVSTLGRQLRNTVGGDYLSVRFKSTFGDGVIIG